MEISLNGENIQLEDNSTLLALLEKHCFAQRKGVAIAVNDVVAPKARWNEVILVPNDRVLIIAATKGG